MKKYYVLLLILLMGFSSAIELDINCPKEVLPYQEFECGINIKNLTGTWDLKADITFDGKRVAKIYNEGENKWQSSYYYLKDFVKGENDYKIKLNITEQIQERLPASIKLRHDGKTEFFNFKIRMSEGYEEVIIQSTEKELVVSENIEESGGRKITLSEIKSVTTNAIKGSNELAPTKTIIKKNEVIYEEEVIYESKNEKLKKYTIYGFCFLLIVVIALLLIEKNGKGSNDC